jgi:hypothetical protein
MTAPVQRTLPNLLIHESQRLLDLRFAKAAFGVDEDSALGLIENGTLPWAFNISSGDKVREVRVLAASLTFPPTTFATLDAVIDHVIPPSRTNLRSGELCAWWDCGRDLLERAINNRHLAGTVSGHTLWIEAASAREFLKRRRIV